MCEKVAKRKTGGHEVRPSKRRCTGATPELVRDVLPAIFSHLNVRELRNASQVCMVWRDEIKDNAVQFWRGMCERAGLLDSQTYSRIQFSALMVHSRVRRLEIMAKKAAVESAERVTKNKQLVMVYRSHYFRFHDFVCRHCLRVQFKRIEYPLYGANVRLCFECQRLEPYAWIRRSSARRHFRFGTKLFEREGSPLPCVETFKSVYGKKSSGPLYRFCDIVKLAADTFGQEFADKQAKTARRVLRIGKMKGEHLRDI